MNGVKSERNVKEGEEMEVKNVKCGVHPHTSSMQIEKYYKNYLDTYFLGEICIVPVQHRQYI